MNRLHRVHTRLYESGQQIDEAFANFTILPQTIVGSKITTDKISYSSSEQVTLTSTITSKSANSTITGLEATINITDPNNNTILTETKALTDLLPGARTEIKTITDTGTDAPGLYTANLLVKTNEEALTNAQTNYEIISSLDQAKSLAGTITATPNNIIEKETTTITYTVRNIGNTIDLPIITADIHIVDPDTQQPVRTITDETSLNGTEVYTNSIQFDSTGLQTKPYMIVLQGATAGVTQPLASTGLAINPNPNYAPTANAGLDQTGFAGQTITFDGTGSTDPDGDSLVYNWNIMEVPVTSEVNNASIINPLTPTPSFVPDQEGTYTLSLKVNDGLADSNTDTVSAHINPAPKVDVHPETINLKSNGGSKSITAVLTSPGLSSFKTLTEEDGETVTATFTLENRYTDKNGEQVTFTIPQDIYPGDDMVTPADTDKDGVTDQYQLTLKFNRDLIIAGFTEANGQLRITQPTELVSTVIANGVNIGNDISTAILPPVVSKGRK